ncbi:hypothetical protein VNI00_006360 [Paramarasmius palmivorus]|uniref:Uncharacterized protein n=1 Tax=Paramarasmius palmivorus TaxID=297713 RepID=A0AAW0D9H8_9AGAR
MSERSWKGHSQANEVVAVLNSISASEKFAQAVQGIPSHSAWLPPSPTEFDEKSELHDAQDFIKSLQIPRVGKLSFPPMLLHRLGSFKFNEESRKRKEDVFSGENTFLVNASGSGKTRLLFEGLCDEWGLYFTSHVDSGMLGSFDVQKTIVEYLSGETGFVLYPSLLPEHEAAQAVALNSRLAHHASSSEGISQELRRSWLHFQLRPNVQSDDDESTENLEDALLSLCDTMSDAEMGEEVLNDAIAQTSEEIFSVLGESARVFVVLDEANVAAQRYKESFGTPGNYYPLLKAMVKAWRDLLKDLPFVFVVAGTEVPREHFANDDDWSDFVWNSNTGGFDTVEKQKHYVQQFLPQNLQESVGDSLARRMWRWVRGRHRFTSAYIAVLLEHSYSKPLTYLDIVIHQGTGYFPHDVKYDVPPPSGITPFAQLNFTAISIDRRLRSYVHLALMDVLISSSKPGYPIEAIKLVNEGMGRFTDSRCSHIVVDEPLIIARAVTWFTSDEGEVPASILNYQYFVEHLVDPDMAPRHSPAYLAFALALAFSKSRRISDILALSRPAPSWSRRNADIVARALRDGDVVEHLVRDVDSAHQTLVTYSTSLTDTLSWLQHSHPTPFCIHVTDTTATLIFIIKLSNGSRFWAAMRVLHSLADVEDIAGRVRDTIHDLQPENLFQNSDSHEPSSDIFEALDSLPNICPQVGHHGILPVIAVIGKDVDRDILATPGLSRVALLNLDEISRAMELIPSEKVAERIVDAVTRDPEKTEEQPEVAEEVTRPKGRKGKARAAVSNPSGPKRTRGSSLVQHDADSSGHDQSSKGSRYNLRPRAKRITR